MSVLNLLPLLGKFSSCLFLDTFKTKTLENGSTHLDFFLNNNLIVTIMEERSSKP